MLIAPVPLKDRRQLIATFLQNPGLEELRNSYMLLIRAFHSKLVYIPFESWPIERVQDTRVSGYGCLRAKAKCRDGG